MEELLCLTKINQGATNNFLKKRSYLNKKHYEVTTIFQVFYWNENPSKNSSEKRKISVKYLFKTAHKESQNFVWETQGSIQFAVLGNVLRTNLSDILRHGLVTFNFKQLMKKWTKPNKRKIVNVSGKNRSWKPKSSTFSFCFYYPF